jgi:hypothetical protein
MTARVVYPAIFKSIFFSSRNPSAVVAMADPFSYHDVPLHTEGQSIRLVTINTSNSTVLIPCRLENFPLDSAPPYTALSYTWGDETVTRKISVNGKDFSVRENLWQFINSRRRVGTSKDSRNPISLVNARKKLAYMWIDALCIDQNNVQERNHQVGLMRQIFSNVSETAVGKVGSS